MIQARGKKLNENNNRQESFQPRRSSRLRLDEKVEKVENKQEERLRVGPWTEEEYKRLDEMKDRSHGYTWREIGKELNRGWRDVRAECKVRGQRVRQWDDYKVHRRLFEQWW